MGESRDDILTGVCMYVCVYMWLCIYTQKCNSEFFLFVFCQLLQVGSFVGLAGDMGRIMKKVSHSVKMRTIRDWS